MQFKREYSPIPDLDMFVEWLPRIWPIAAREESQNPFEIVRFRMRGLNGADMLRESLKGSLPALRVDQELKSYLSELRGRGVLSVFRNARGRTSWDPLLWALWQYYRFRNPV